MDDRECQGPFRTIVPLVLASKSPRRRRLLQGLGIDFQVQEAKIEELSPGCGLAPSDFVIENARAKAKAVAKDHTGKVILGADTCVFVEGQILGKPRDYAEALSMLGLLSGRWHKVFTGFHIENAGKGLEYSKVVESEVFLDPISNQLLEAYCRSREPYDKAGGYAVQGIGSFMVRQVRGSYTNVVGLPLFEVVEVLFKIGVLSPWEQA